MSLGRAPLLIEGLPARRSADPLEKTQELPRFRMSHADLAEPQAKPPQPRPVTAKPPVGLSSGDHSASSEHDPAKSFHISLSGATLEKMNARPPETARSPAATKDPHEAFNKLPREDAMKHLQGIWDRRHDDSGETQKELDWNKSGGSYNRPVATGRVVPMGQSRRLPTSMPGTAHPDQQVRDYAFKLQAHRTANLLGDTYDRQHGTPPRKRAHAHVVRNTKTGATSVVGQLHGRNRPKLPDGHEIVRTVASEGLDRIPLLAESLTIEPKRQPSLTSDDELQRRLDAVRAELKTATGEAIARLRARENTLATSQKFRAELRDTAKEPREPTDASEASTAKLRTVDPNAKTNIMRPPGHRTEVLRPPGHKTEPAMNRVQQGAATAVIPVRKTVTSLDDEPRGNTKTAILPAQKMVSSTLYRGPLLQELMSTFPAGTRISGAPGVQGVTDTSKVGLVTDQGRVVPDKKKRELKIPKPKKLRNVRDPITAELEQQPSFAGMASPLLGRLSRTEQAMAEHCGTEDVLAITSSRNGYGIVDPKDDHVGVYRQFREACPDSMHIGHAAFCSRCDNSYPTRTGGVDWLTRSDWKKLSPTATPEDPYKIRGNSTGE